MTKKYQKPAMRVVKLQHRGQILVGSEVRSMHSNAGLGLGGSDKICGQGSTPSPATKMKQ